MLALCAAVTLTGALLYRSYKDTMVVSQLQASYPNVKSEMVLAEKYWSMYPDVGASSYFGRDGRLESYGARMHYLLVGKSEGKTWPE